MIPVNWAKNQTTLRLPLCFCSNNTQTNKFHCYLYLLNWSLSVPVHSWHSSFWGWGCFLGWSIDVISDRLVVPEAWSLTVKDSHMRAVMLTHSWARPHTHIHMYGKWIMRGIRGIWLSWIFKLVSLVSGGTKSWLKVWINPAVWKLYKLFFCLRQIPLN